MITDVFASSFPHFYRSRVFSRSLTRAIFHTILAISLLEVVRVGAFYEANRAAFARLDLHRIASELDNFPTDIELTFRKTRAAYSTKVSLTVSRELPFRLELSRSISLDAQGRGTKAINASRSLASIGHKAEAGGGGRR